MFSNTRLFYPWADDYGPYALLAVAAILLLTHFLLHHSKSSFHLTCKTMKPGLSPKERLIDKTIIQARDWTDTSRSIEVENKQHAVKHMSKSVLDEFMTRSLSWVPALFPGHGHGGGHHSILQLALREKTGRTTSKTCLVGSALTISQSWRYIP
jgi:hypothetical protein